MEFKFGPASESNAVGVRPPIIVCARRALVISTQDFGLFEGLRALARQRVLYASKLSRTLNSCHLPHPDDGLSDAIDLVPFILGRLQWQMPACLAVAVAMHQASRELALPLTWGGVWDRKLHELDVRHLATEMQRYRARYIAKHPAVFIDGEWHQPEPLVDAPHFEGERHHHAIIA